MRCVCGAARHDAAVQRNEENTYGTTKTSGLWSILRVFLKLCDGQLGCMIGAREAPLIVVPKLSQLLEAACMHITS